MTDKAFGDWDAEALARFCEHRVGRQEDPAAQDRVRRRLLATLASEERFLPFYSELSRSFAMTVDALRAVLRRIDDPASYEAAPMPGVRFFHFPPGRGCGFAEAGIVKMDRGARFPRHRHDGDEINVILEGALIDGGVLYGPGALVRNAPGSEHDYSAGELRDLILVAGHNGIRYLDG